MHICLPARAMASKYVLKSKAAITDLHWPFTIPLTGSGIVSYAYVQYKVGERIQFKICVYKIRYVCIGVGEYVCIHIRMIKIRQAYI